MILSGRGLSIRGSSLLLGASRGSISPRSLSLPPSLETGSRARTLGFLPLAGWHLFSFFAHVLRELPLQGFCIQPSIVLHSIAAWWCKAVAVNIFSSASSSISCSSRRRSRTLALLPSLTWSATAKARHCKVGRGEDLLETAR